MEQMDLDFRNTSATRPRLEDTDKRVKKGNRVVQEKGKKKARKLLVVSSPVAWYLPIYFKELHDIDCTRDLNGGGK